MYTYVSQLNISFRIRQKYAIQLISIHIQGMANKRKAMYYLTLFRILNCFYI